MRSIQTLILILFIVNVCRAQHISTLGNLNKELSNLKKGDEILISDGIYKNINLIVENKNNIIIRAKNPGRVIIEGRSSITFNNCNNIKLSGFVFNKTFSKELIKLNNSKNLLIENNLFKECGGGRYACLIGLNNQSVGNTIKNNTLDGNMTIGIAIKDDKNYNNDISFNYFKNVPRVKDLFPQSDGNGMECIQIGRGMLWDSRTSVYNNVFENIIGDAAEIISVKSNQNKLFNNFFQNNRGGITLRIGNNSEVYNNTFIKTSHPIRAYGSGHKIYNNTIEEASVGIQVPSGDADSNNKTPLSAPYFRPKNITISNNKIQSTVKPITIGNGYSNNRSKVPQSIVIKDNQFDKDYWWEDQNGKKRKDKFLQNKLLINKEESKSDYIRDVGVQW